MCGLLLQPDSEGEFIYTLSVQRFWDVCGAPSCSVCHWDLFLLEIFRTWTSRGWSPLLPVEGGAGRFPRPHPTTLWWLCPSRLRAGWLLANFAWNVPLASLIFLKRSLVFPILLFSSISLHWLLRKAFLSILAILWNSAFRCLYLSFSLLLFASLLFTAICKASSDSCFALLHCSGERNSKWRAKLQGMWNWEDPWRHSQGQNPESPTLVCRRALAA